MMQDNARKLTYGAMMVAIFVVLVMISFYIPLFGTITMLFIPLPIILYRLRYDRKASLLVTLAAILVSLIGGILLVFVALVFGALGFVIGEAIQQKRTKFYTFMASGLTFLISTILIYYLSVVLFGINSIEVFYQMMEESQQQVMTYINQIGEVPDEVSKQLYATFDATLKAVPTAFILSCYLFALVVILINLPIAKRLGHDVPTFPAFREMKLPVLIVWVYMLIILMPLLFGVESDSMAELIYINASFLLRFLFFLQGIAFIHHVIHTLKPRKWLPILATLVAFLFSPFIVILGILDTGLNLRALISKNNSR